MKKTIWKFQLLSKSERLMIPKGGEILTLQAQNGNPCLWVLVDADNEKEERYFEIFGTGHDIPSDTGINRKYIGTFQQNQGLLVYHVFEIID